MKSFLSVWIRNDLIFVGSTIDIEYTMVRRSVQKTGYSVQAGDSPRHQYQPSK